MAQGMTAQDLIGHRLLDQEGRNVGKIGHVYVDDTTGQPTWVTVQTGMFGQRETFVPLQGAQPAEEDIKVPFDKATIKDAPNVDVDEHISEQEEEQIFQHYGMTPTVPGQREGGEAGHHAREGQERVQEQGRARQRPGGEEEASVVRSEEQVDVGLTRQERGQARLRKYVQSEQVEEDVPVQREELEVERRPVTDPGQVGERTSMGEDEQRFVLHEERPVVSKKEVPVEEVHVKKKQVSDEERVRAERRVEQVEVDEDEQEGRRPGGKGRPPA